MSNDTRVRALSREDPHELLEAFANVVRSAPAGPVARAVPGPRQRRSTETVCASCGLVPTVTGHCKCSG
jgi:hypothetical protein